MRIAITGSSGLIGRALVRSLEGDGHEVVRLVRRPPGPGELRWDPERGEIDTAGLAGADGVVHLAGAGIADRRWSAARKREILESRTRGTDLVARAVARLDPAPGVLVSASGINVYGDRGDEVLHEASRPGDGFLTDVVLAWERATLPAQEAGIRVAHLRSGMVLDGTGGALARMATIFRLGIGGRIGSGRQWWSWISLHDEVRAIRFLLEHPVGGPVNATAPEPVTNAEFTRALGAALHRPTLLPIPAFGPGLLLGRELARELLLGSMRVVPTVLQGAGFEFAHPTLPEALAAALT